MLVTDCVGQKQFLGMIFDIPATVEMACWNKCFKKAKIMNYFDTEMSYSEDLLFLLDYCQQVEKVSLINEPLVFIREREESAIHQKVLHDVFKRNMGYYEKCVKKARSISSVHRRKYNTMKIIRILNRRERLIELSDRGELVQLRRYAKGNIGTILYSDMSFS